MSEEREIRGMIEDASQAHCDLNIFYGVIAILEGGTISSASDAAAQRIIKICRDHAGVCLKRMDRAADKIIAKVPA